jgi:hypothetical protein
MTSSEGSTTEWNHSGEAYEVREPTLQVPPQATSPKANEAGAAYFSVKISGDRDHVVIWSPPTPPKSATLARAANGLIQGKICDDGTPTSS